MPPEKEEKVARTVVDVKCSTCGHPAQIVFDDSSKDAEGNFPETTWKCNCYAGVTNGPKGDCTCEALNVREGHPGELGEGALNPAAAALTDEQLAEAYERRIVPLKMNGGMSTSGTTTKEGK